ncbi:MAG: ABC transporter ATP-binding protein [Bacteroidales bacterium]|nr:ABC transporter ATP-binding protein [Bacteroidales bacterium]
MDKVIEIHEIVKNYQIGSVIVRALRSVSLEIKRNEYVAIMGPSGSGKSTLMNILGCLDTPTKGQYILNGTDVSKMEDDMLAEIRNKEIGFVFQTFNLLPRYTALENVTLPLIYAQRQRVAIARAMVNDPSIILADEPTGNLDSKTSADIMGLLDKIHDNGNTVIVVTHEEDIARHAHRIIKLMDGEVSADYVNEKRIEVRAK